MSETEKETALQKRVRKMKTYADKDGNQVPSGFIHKIDRDKHAMAERYAKKAQKLSDALKEFKEAFFEEADQLYQRSLDDAKVKRRDNAKGSYTISTIDKRIKCEVTVNEFMTFNDNISLAQEKLHEYLSTKTNSIDDDLKAIINSAFETSKGRLDVKRIIGLKKLNIKDELWLAAMSLIDQSYEVRNTKRYGRIWILDEQGEYQNVCLDFASL
jgi:hypothetical protein